MVDLTKEIIFNGGFGAGFGQDPFNLPKKKQTVPGVMGKLDSFLNAPGGSMLMNLLAQEGYSTMPSSPFGAIGRAYGATQQQGQQRDAFDLQRKLIESQIGFNNRRGGVTGADGAIGKLSPTMYTPKSVQEFNESVASGSPDYSKLEFRPELRIYQDPGGGVHVADIGASSGGGQNQPPLLSTPEATQQAAQRKSAETEAVQDPARERSLPTSLVRIDQTLSDVDEVLAALDSGELRTGPAQQIGARFKTSGEKLQALANTKVIDLISTATFGQLSEGERSFLSDIVFGLGRTEGFNKDKLKEFKRIMQKVREIEAKDAERLGVGGDIVNEAADIASKYE